MKEGSGAGEIRNEMGRSGFRGKARGNRKFGGNGEPGLGGVVRGSVQRELED